MASVRMRCGKAVFTCVVAAMSLALANPAGLCARASRRIPKAASRGPVYQFLVNNGVPIDSDIRVAKLSAVMTTGSVVRGVVKVIGPEKLLGPKEIKDVRKRVEKEVGKAGRVVYVELELMRQNILAGEVIPPHVCDKLGELELFFSKTRSLRIGIGTDMFYIRIGNNDCTFRSSSLREQLNKILER